MEPRNRFQGMNSASLCSLAGRYDNPVCYVNIVYGNLKSENSQDYAQKPQRNCTFMNLASGNIRSIGEKVAYNTILRIKQESIQIVRDKIFLFPNILYCTRIQYTCILNIRESTIFYQVNFFVYFLSG
jgi:hypothetical protein